MTIDRTLVVEVVVPRASRRERHMREQMKVTTRAKWAEWQRMLDGGGYGSMAELARSMGISRAAVTKGLAKLRNVTEDA